MYSEGQNRSSVWWFHINNSVSQDLRSLYEDVIYTDRKVCFVAFWWYNIHATWPIITHAIWRYCQSTPLMVLSLSFEIHYVLLCEGSLASISSKIGGHVDWNYINPLQVQACMNSFFTTASSSDTVPLPTFLFFLIQDCLYALPHPQTHFWLVIISKLHFKHFSELSKTTGGHPKMISPHDLCYSTHLLDLEGLLQQCLQNTLIVDPNNWYEGCYQAKITSLKPEDRRRGWIWLPSTETRALMASGGSFGQMRPKSIA